MIKAAGSRVTICLDDESAKLIHERAKLKKNSKNILKVEEGTQWIEKNLIGNPKKEDLDK